jgi:hypothetical protein
MEVWDIGEFSEFSDKFCYECKTALKNKISLKNKAHDRS